MSKAVFKYLYLVIGTGLATLTTIIEFGDAQRRADPDNDGENERSASAIMHQQEQQLQRHGTARSPMEAATYRAEELVKRPLRTLLLIVGYEVLFVGVAVSVAYPEGVIQMVGQDFGEIIALIAAVGESVLPATVIPLLPPAGVVLGLVFALVLHQSVKTAGDIRRAFAQ